MKPVIEFAIVRYASPQRWAR